MLGTVGLRLSIIGHRRISQSWFVLMAKPYAERGPFGPYRGNFIKQYYKYLFLLFCSNLFVFYFIFYSILFHKILSYLKGLFVPGGLSLTLKNSSVKYFINFQHGSNRYPIKHSVTPPLMIPARPVCSLSNGASPTPCINQFTPPIWASGGVINFPGPLSTSVRYLLFKSGVCPAENMATS